MLKEIKASEAVKAHEEGKPIKVMRSCNGGRALRWWRMEDILGGCLFFIDEPDPEPGKEPEEKPEGSWPVPPPKEGKRKKVDIGKIMALHNAGWSNAKIADEMGLHPVTVGKYVNQELTKIEG